MGARGFNQYDGTVKSIKFKSLVTRGDGSIGVQVSKPVGSIEVEEGITTLACVQAFRVLDSAQLQIRDD